jgi:hypothetical protein
MRVRILQQAGDWNPGVHDVPDHQARKLLATGYASELRIGKSAREESSSSTGAGPTAGAAPVEAAAVAHGSGDGRQGQKRERR